MTLNISEIRDRAFADWANANSAVAHPSDRAFITDLILMRALESAFNDALEQNFGKQVWEYSSIPYVCGYKMSGTKAGVMIDGHVPGASDFVVMKCAKQAEDWVNERLQELLK